MAGKESPHLSRLCLIYEACLVGIQRTERLALGIRA